MTSPPSGLTGSRANTSVSVPVGRRRPLSTDHNFRSCPTTWATEPRVVFQSPFPAYFQLGHPGTGITQIPLVPNMCVPRQHVIQRPRSPAPHSCTHAHTCMHTHHAYDNTLAQCTTPWEYRQDPHLSRRPWPEGALRPLQLLSLPPAKPPSAPHSQLGTWGQAALLPARGG